MESIREQYAKELKNLEISGEDTITARFVSIKFKRKALTKLPREMRRNSKNSSMTIRE